MKLNNNTMRKVIVSPETLGMNLRLYDVHPYYEYVNSQRTDNILGYTYSVLCPNLAGNLLGVKIPGKQLLFDDAYDHLVQFKNFCIGIYPIYASGQNHIQSVNLKATADNVVIIDS